MSETLVDTLPIWTLLIGAGLLSLGGLAFKSTSAWGPLTLLLIFLTGVSLNSSVTSIWIDAVKNDVALSDGATPDAAHTWRILWQTIVLASGFLIVLMTLDDADTVGERAPSRYPGLWYALLVCSIAGLCGLACASTLWELFVAGRLCYWPLLFGFRYAEPMSFECDEGTPKSRVTWNRFRIRLRANFQRSTAVERPEISDPIVMLVWRELWSMLLMLSGLTLLAVWTGSPSLSLSALQEFQPGVQQSLNGGIAGLLLIIAGAGWTIPLNLETLDIAEGGDHSSTAWLLSVQILAAVITVSTAALRTSLGTLVFAEVMLMVIAGWAFVLGGYLVGRQCHLRRWLAGLVLAQSGWWITCVALAVAQQSMAQFAPFTELMYPHNVSVVPFLILADLTALFGFSAICRFVLNGERELTFMDDLRGMFRQQPAASALAAISLLSLLGFPLTAGFWGRWQVICGFWSVQLIQPRTGLPTVHGGFVVLAVAALWSQIVIMQAIWQPLRMMLFEAPAGRIATDNRQAALSVAILAAFVVVGIGMMPDALLRELRQLVRP